ncbi:MAG: transcriptional repressor [Planctomycetes bacterium]|nr:transcriptional repressor [Planctomycetota bacterium]
MTRKTEQRLAIRKVLDEAEGPLSIPEILDRAQAVVPGLGTATVYRNVKAAVEEGDLTVVDVPGEPTRYEAAHQHHHHHFKCLRCGKVYDIEGCFDELDALAPEGFEAEGHELTLYGRCPDCKPSVF